MWRGVTQGGGLRLRCATVAQVGGLAPGYQAAPFGAPDGRTRHSSGRRYYAFVDLLLGGPPPLSLIVGRGTVRGSSG